MKPAAMIAAAATLLLTACGGRLAPLDEGAPAYTSPEHNADAGADADELAPDAGHDAAHPHYPPPLFDACSPWDPNPCPEPYICTVDAWGRNPGCTVWFGSPLCVTGNWQPVLRDEGSAMICEP